MGEKRYSLGEAGCYYTKLIIDNKTKHELGNSIIVKILNEQQAIIERLKEENEQLRKQIQNYEQLISNSYVGIEETLDGFVGKYVIWEDELQKYRKKE